MLQAAQLQHLRNSQQVNYNSSKPHVLLELMLLHVEPASAWRQPYLHCLEQDTPTAAAAAGTSLMLGSSFDSTHAAAACDPCSEGDIELHVLVSAASNVPLVPG